MRTAIGLIVLGLVGGVLPTGLAGSAHAAQVLAGTAGALLSLLVSCVAVAAAARRISAKIASAAPRRQRTPLVSSQSGARTIARTV
jgi:hypothetical protein